MNSVTMMANVVGVIVVIFVATAFITLAIFYLKAQKKLISNGLEDEDIRRDVQAQLDKTRQNYATLGQAKAYFAREEKRQTHLHRLSWAVCVALCALVVGILSFSNVLGGNCHVWLGNKAMLTIQTSSMASVNQSNTYLTENDQRIEQYSFITISRDPSHIDGIRVGDIVAFTMESEGKTLTVVHRLIEIGENSSGDPVYTFRGDANPSSMAGEFQIGKERIVGVFQTKDYQGVKNVALGCFICYLQSSMGITMVAMAFVLMLIYQFLSEGANKVYALRFEQLKWETLAKMLPADDAAPENIPTQENAP